MGVVAAGVVLGAAVVGPKALVLIVAVAVTMAAAELYQGLRARGYQPATLLGLAACASVVGAAYWQGERALPLVTAILLVFTFLWYLTGVVKGRPTMNVAVSVMAYLYVGFLGSYAALIFHIPIVGKSGTIRPEHATGILLAAVLATVAHDVGSYFIGRYAGKTPLAPDDQPPQDARRPGRGHVRHPGRVRRCSSAASPRGTRAGPSGWRWWSASSPPWATCASR